MSFSCQSLLFFLSLKVLNPLKLILHLSLLKLLPLQSADLSCFIHIRGVTCSSGLCYRDKACILQVLLADEFRVFLCHKLIELVILIDKGY